MRSPVAGRTLHLLGAIAAAIAALPLVYLCVRTADAGLADIVDTLWRERTLRLTVRSLGLALSVAGACVVIGVPTAWLISQAALPWRGLWLVLASLPLAVPSYVAAYAWVALVPGFSGFGAAWLVLTLVSTPYVVLPVAAALRGVDPALVEVARSLGTSRLRVFLSVVVPQASPAAAAGALLVALYALSDFGAVAILRFDAFTRVIYTSYRASFDRTTAAVLSLVLVALAALLVLAEQRARGRAQRWRVARGSARPAEPVRLGAGGPFAIAWLVSLSVLALGIPAYSLIRMLGRSRRAGFELDQVTSAAASTVAVSTAGALVAIALALPIGVLAARYRDRWSRRIEGVAYLGHALPGVVVGLSFVFLSLTLVPALYQSVTVLAVAYAVLFLPNAVGSVRASTAQVPPVLDEVARSLGRRPTSAWRSITLRLTWPGIAAGALLVLLTAMKELPATLMLRPTGLDTLATEMWTRTQVSAYAAAAPFAVALVLVAAIPAFVVSQTVVLRRQASRSVPEPTPEEPLLVGTGPVGRVEL